MKTAGLLLMSLLAAPGAVAQQSASKGVPAPATIRATAITDASQVSLFNSVKIEGEKFVASMKVRVLSAWGDNAGLEGDVLLSRVYIALNEDGTDLRVYRLPQLLDPKVVSIAAPGGTPIVTLEYGLPKQRRTVRLFASLNGVRVLGEQK